MTDNAPCRSPKRPVPECAGREHEADFWGSHDFADYRHDWTPVKARFAGNLFGEITIRLDPETIRQVRSQARANGINPTTLIRTWLLERLQGKHASLAEAMAPTETSRERFWRPVRSLIS